MIIPTSWRKQNINLIRNAIISAVLILSFYTGYRLELSLLRLLILFLSGAVLSIVLLRRPHWWPVLLIIASLVIPFELGTGTQTTINTSVLLLVFLLALWIFEGIILKRGFHLLHSLPVFPLLGFCVITSIAFVVGQVDWFIFAPHAPLRSQFGGLALFLLSAMAFLLVAQRVSNMEWLEKLVWIFLGLAAGIILSGIVPGMGRLQDLYNEGATGSLFWIWVVSLSFSQALINKKLELKWRALLMGLAIITLANRFFISGSWASGWLPAGIAMLTILVINLPRMGLFLVPIAAYFGVTSLQTFLSGVATTTVQYGEEYSYLTRIEAWQIVGNIIRTNPVTGFGPANYYFYTPLIPLRGYYLQFNSHNQYVDLVAQTGFVGLAFFLWFFGEIGRLAWRLKESAPEGFGQAYAVGTLGGLAGMLASGMLGDWIIPFVYNIGFNGFQASILGWIFMGGLVALENITMQKERE